jgi:hypothetical protein
MATASAFRSPRWYGIPFRVLLMTFIGTLLSFAVVLFLSIIGTVMISAVRGVHPDMRIAYRHIALPAALAIGAVVLMFSVVGEMRHYRQSKSLAAIEKMS